MMASAKVIHKEVRHQVEIGKISRRELAVGGAAAGVAWYSLPRAKPGEIVTVTAEELPSIGSLLSFPARRFHLARTDNDELIALSGECTFRLIKVCLVKWVPITHRFECPCCGSKFELNGKYIEDIAPRSLDRYAITVIFADGSTVTTNDVGDPIAINGREIASVTVDTRDLIRRAGRI